MDIIDIQLFFARYPVLSGCAKKLFVCTKGKSCGKRYSDDIYRVLKKAIEKFDLDDVYKVKKSDCLGLCEHGPIVTVAPFGLSYGGVRETDCAEILTRHRKKKKPIKRLLVAKKTKHK